jgi:hypothetical protein
MSRPSVLGRCLTEARQLLEAAGVPVTGVAQTKPPGGAPPGPLRVVQERSTSEGVFLVTAASVELAEGEDDHAQRIP